MTGLDATNSDPVRRLIIAATAVVLCRGGLTMCADLIAVLGIAVQELWVRPTDAAEAEIVDASTEVVDAIFEINGVRFDEGRDKLSRALARYWAARARDPTVVG